MSDSDPDFWDLGEDRTTTRHQRRRPRHRKSKGFPDFPLNLGDNDDDNLALPRISNSGAAGDKWDNTRERDGKEGQEDARLITNYDVKKKLRATEEVNNDENDEEDNDSDEDSEDESGQESESEDKEQEGATESSSESSKRTSLVSGSDLPQDSLKDARLNDESPKSSKESTDQSQWVVEEHLLPPQQKLKLALYRGRRLLGPGVGPGIGDRIGAGDQAVREFVRARALARVVHGDQHWRYCRCKVFLAQAYLYLKDYAPQAESEAKEALETITLHLSTNYAPNKKPQVHHTLLWGHLVCGEARTRLGQLVPAQDSLAHAFHHTRTYTRMVAKRKKKLTPSLTMDRPLDLHVKVLCAQATLFTKRKRFTKAREKLESSVALLECEGAGGEDPGLVEPLQQLARLLLDHTDQHQPGLECLARAVHITQVSNRPGSVAECEARGLLVERRLRLRAVDSQEALRELHKLGLLFSRLHGEHSIRTLAIHNLTVQVLVQEEDYQQATQHLRTRLRQCKDAYGDYSPQVCGVFRQLSRVLALSGDISGAATALDQCLHAETLIYGTSSRRAQASRVRLGDLIQKLPLAMKMKMYRKHPELQNKPRFKNI